MNKTLSIFSCCFFFAVLTGCRKPPTQPEPVFHPVPAVKPLLPVLNEVSGIAASRTHPGFLWAHEDSGTPPQLHLIKQDGTVTKQVFLKGITNRDWEEMAWFNNEIFLAETGDNALNQNSYRFYKFAEPTALVDTVELVTTIHFQYPDGPHDAEAFFIDPQSKHIFIITKRDQPSRMYRLDFPYTDHSTVNYVASLPYSHVVAAAISDNGKEIMVKTYSDIFYYQRPTGEPIGQCLQKPYTRLPYVMEPQGEALCFAADNTGYFTLSEKAFSSTVNLYFYRRN